jgi:hypothetical protein
MKIANKPKTLAVTAGIVLSLLVAPAPGQDASKQQMQQKLITIKQSMDQSKVLLRRYTWTETTEVSPSALTNS